MQMGSKQPQDKVASRQQQSGGGGRRERHKKEEKNKTKNISAHVAFDCSVHHRGAT